MDGKAFDQAARKLATHFSRRGLWGTASSVGLGAAVARLPIAAAARKKRKRNKKPKLKLNVFGCVNVGGRCRKAGDCCSGVCQGKKGKKRCRAHDTSGCLAGQQEEQCSGDVTVTCSTPSGDVGNCNTTTGNAGYCTASGQCFACQTDADCRPFCGPTAACIVCAGECKAMGGTACVGANEDECEFPPA